MQYRPEGKGYQRHGEAGKTPTPEYTAWNLMIGRCCNANHPDFHQCPEFRTNWANLARN